MSSEQQWEILLLRVSNTDVRAYIAAFGVSSDETPKLAIKSPQSIARVKDFEVQGNDASTPVFDATEQQIIWACYGNPTPGKESEQKSVQLWRVDSHLSLVSVEDVPTLRASSASQPPGLFVKGALIGVSVQSPVEGKSWVYDVPKMAQNVKDPHAEPGAKDSGWTVLSYNTNTKPIFGHSSRLVQNADLEVKFVYHIKLDRRFETSTGNHVFVEQMRAADFEKLPSSKNYLWQSYDIDCGWDTSANPAYVFTRSQYVENTPTKRRLYLFRLIRGGESKIDAAYIDLRADGSVNSPTSTVKAKQREQIVYKGGRRGWAKNLQALDLADGRIMLMWTVLETEGSRDDWIPRAMVTSVDKDGDLTWPWKEVSISWEKPILDNEPYVGWSAVLVHKDFVS